jgi:SAM-dependent methyltransferase
VLSRLADGRGRTAADWALAPLADASRALEILPDGDGVVLAVDTGRVRADADRLPLRTNAVDGLCLTAVLAGTTELDALFAEVRRVLRPAGTLVVVSPSAAVRSPGQLRLRALHRRGWANRSALDDVGWLLAAADFAVISDDRVAYGVAVPADDPDALATELTGGGWWPPGAGAGLAAAAGGRWPVPLRRLVARR